MKIYPFLHWKPNYFGVAYSLETRHSLTTETMEFAINSASLEVDFVIRSSCKMNLIEF